MARSRRQRLTRSEFDRMCGRTVATKRLAESGAEPEPLFEIEIPGARRPADDLATATEEDQ